MKVTPAQAGCYMMAVAIAERMQILPRSISSSFLPHLTNEPGQRRTQVPLVYRLTLLISFGSALFFAICGTGLIYVLLPDFLAAIAPLLILLPGIAVQGGSAIFAADLAAREKPKYSIIIGYTMLLLNITLNLVLIPKIGINGAAIASMIAYSCAAILWLIFYLRESEIPLCELFVTKADCMYLYRSVLQSFRHNLKKTRNFLGNNE